MLQANVVVLQVVEDEADHPHDLLFVREVKDLRNVFDHIRSEVLEQGKSKLVVAQDPERTGDIVSDLPVSLTLVFKNFYENQETSLLDELLRQIVDAEHVHEAVRVGHAMKSRCVVLGLKQEVQEVDSFFAEDSFVAKAREANQLGKGMCGQFTVQSFIFFAILVEEAAQDADAVKLLVRVARLLDLCEVPDSIAPVLNDTIKES